MNLRLMALNLKQFCPQLSIPVVKQRINVRYRQILGQEDWEFLNESTTLATVSGTYRYSVASVSDLISVTYETLLKEVYQDWINSRDPERSESGVPSCYSIYSKSKASEGVVSFDLWPTPDDVYTLTLYYKKTISDLVEDTDEPVFRPEVIEAGALWDCYRLEYAVTQNPAYIGLARDAQQDYQMLLRQLLIEDLSTTSLPRRVREVGQFGQVNDEFALDHDVWGM